jgi:hypothetical protein
MYIDKVYELEHFPVFNSDTRSTSVTPLRLAYRPHTLLSQQGLGLAVVELCLVSATSIASALKVYFLLFMVQAEHTIVYCQKITCI